MQQESQTDSGSAERGSVPVVGSGRTSWTRPIVLCALFNLLLATGLLAAGLAWPGTAPVSGYSRAAMHLAVLGWLTLLLFGVLFELVPSVTGQALGTPWLSLATLAFLECGTLAMAGGFVVPGSVNPLSAWLLPLGAVLVFVGVLSGIVNVLAPMVPTWPLPLAGNFILVALGFLLLTAMLGLSFAITMGTSAATAQMHRLVDGGIGYHALAGLGGWLSLAGMGVSYEVVPRWMGLEPRRHRGFGAAVCLLATGGTVLAVMTGLARLWFRSPVLAVAGYVGWLAIAASAVLYLLDMLRFYRARERGGGLLDAPAPLGVTASLLVALGLAVALLATGRMAALAPPLVLIVVLGWLTGLGLTWLSPGHKLRAAVPSRPAAARSAAGLRKEAVAPLPAPAPWPLLYFPAVWLATLGSLIGNDGVARVAMVCVFLAVVLLMRDYLGAPAEPS
ncbi:MAG TPA: hypothetical protein VFA86_07290 [Gammaproteobacteria bacterium]|nr:hypothetical protein [Gammaproteobacteria bacterium]